MLCYSQKSNLGSKRRRDGLAKIRLFAWSMISLLALSQMALAQGSSKSNIDEKSLQTEDNVELKISYFKSSAGKDAPVAILLHGKKGTRQQWKGFATELQSKKDFAVVTVDLRGHGESSLKKSDLKKSDYLAMLAMDMGAVQTFLMDEHQKGNLNINKQGIVATDFSASIALVYAEMNWERAPYDDNPNPELRTPRGQDVRAIALVSPDTGVPGLQATKAAGSLRNVNAAIFIGASAKNTSDIQASKKLYDQFSTRKDKETLYFEKYGEDLRGMDLVLRDAQLRGHISAFLTKYVKDASSEWRDRRSRLERD